jgi:pimeloyl-ACP methyl ester carboxylesterase
MVRLILTSLGVVVLVAIATPAGMIVLGTGDPLPALTSISEPFRKIDYSDLPSLQLTPARKGSPISYRVYRNDKASGNPGPVIIAIHGSSAFSSSMHPLAKALVARGMDVYVPDIRGHGKTGRHGDIDYAAQLDDDLADLARLVRAQHPRAPIVLLGLSAGGGFALHAAAALGNTFDRTVLLAPMLGSRAPTTPQSVYTWARPFIPRIVALGILRRFGIHAFDLSRSWPSPSRPATPPARRASTPSACGAPSARSTTPRTCARHRAPLPWSSAPGISCSARSFSSRPSTRCAPTCLSPCCPTWTTSRSPPTRAPCPPSSAPSAAASEPAHHLTLFSRRALAITLTDDAAIAAAAITGESSRPKTGYSTPAAIGMPAAL